MSDPASLEVVRVLADFKARVTPEDYADLDVASAYAWQIRTLVSEVERLRPLVDEFETLACIIEPHWRGAGAKLEHKWMLSYINGLGAAVDDESDRADKAEAALAATQSKLARAEELLRPFADGWKPYDDPSFHDSTTFVGGLTLGDLRAAAAYFSPPIKPEA